jgi:hypothetical protein
MRREVRGTACEAQRPPYLILSTLVAPWKETRWKETAWQLEPASGPLGPAWPPPLLLLGPGGEWGSAASSPPTMEGGARRKDPGVHHLAGPSAEEPIDAINADGFDKRFCLPRPNRCLLPGGACALVSRILFTVPRKDCTRCEGCDQGLHEVCVPFCQIARGHRGLDWDGRREISYTYTRKI